MVRGIPSKQIQLIADQIAHLEARRGLPAVYVQVAVPVTIETAKLLELLSKVLKSKGSKAEISIVHARVDRITLQALEFSMDDAE